MRRVTGTGVLATEFLDRLEVAVPPEEVPAQLIPHLTAVNDRIGASIREPPTLVTLRDTLLPKLSGDVRLSSVA